MLVAAIYAANKTAAQHDIEQALKFPIDAVELRLDFWRNLNLADVAELKNAFDISMIFTLRSKKQGGVFAGSEKERLNIIAELFAVKPEYFDLEFDVAKSFIAKVHGNYPNTKLICSYHDFDATPHDLIDILESMKNDAFSIYKIATKANSTIDALRMLSFVRESSVYIGVCGLCMGKVGQVTRILSPIVNNALNYAVVNDDNLNVLGQLDLVTLFDIYNYRKLNSYTDVYALLGDPVDQSIGHIFHNKKFRDIKQNAVYVKLPLRQGEEQDFMRAAMQLPFKGFSVTMPLKESLLPFVSLSGDANKIQAINTIKIVDEKLVAFNTDGIGVLNSLEKITTIKEKKLLLVGAGGTARAIAYEAMKRGAMVMVVNRTLSRAKKLANEFGCYFESLLGFDVKNCNYDILVNATSVSLISHMIFSKKIVVNVVYNSPEADKLLQYAGSKDCKIVSGKDVFRSQAVEQQRIWNGESL
ncbi:MAG: shikimate dehydrogenase [Gammaproteobacteria bacterium]|nr:shikimate dehydrogenase [Gammaproteobacteria bacterium]